MNNDEWKEKLTPEQYKVMREKGTEAPFSGKYFATKTDATFDCASCGNPLFDGKTKFQSESLGLRGWPSFSEALPGSVKFVPDDSYGMDRTEVVCAKCGGHLGHVFDEVPGEKETKHFCINSCSLDLKKSEGP